jgi:AraC-like DNA-binding protein
LSPLLDRSLLLVIPTAADTFLFSYVAVRQRATEQLVPDHALCYVVAGELQFQLPTKTLCITPGNLFFIRRNQLAKVVKIPPAAGGEFRAITLFLPQPLLRHHSAVSPVLGVSPGQPAEELVDLSGDVFWQGYFASLAPYFDLPQHFTNAVAQLKVEEAIELLLRSTPQLRQVLFDFSEPGKIDLAAFMLKHYTYRVSLAHFAKLTGRSLATFKRDFQKVFALPPEQWLRRQRLAQAHYLIAQQRQAPATVYLEVGFENLSHFSTAFKQEFGYTASSLATVTH